MGVPCQLGKGGIEQTLEIKLTEQEQAEFEKSASAVRGLVTVIEAQMAPLCAELPAEPRTRRDGAAHDSTQWHLRETKCTGLFSPSLFPVSWAEIGPGLSGSAGVFAYFSLACSLFRTTFRLPAQLVGPPLSFIGLGPFLCHANSLPQARPDS